MAFIQSALDAQHEAESLKRAQLTLTRAIKREILSWGTELGYQTRASVKLGMTRAQTCRLLKGTSDMGLGVLFKVAIRAGINPVVTLTRPAT